jgi:hypothetical protein
MGRSCGIGNLVREMALYKDEVGVKKCPIADKKFQKITGDGGHI